MDIIRREKCFIVGDKQYELLEAKHDPENGVYCGEYIDKDGRQGTHGYTYFTGKAAERICAEQGMGLHTATEVDTLFIGSLRGETDDEKIKLFMLELKLEKAGYINISDKVRYDVGISNYITISKVNESGNVKTIHQDRIDMYSMRNDDQYFIQPVIAYRQL